ncbi:hypothetical protein C0431_09615 [bacterium]|jgi:hypothetical protein|nr:hypothetical protein [bacterium]
MQWVLGIIFLFFLVVLWQFFFILLVATLVASALVAIYFLVRAVFLIRQPGLLDIKEHKGNFYCTIHPSTSSRIGFKAAYFPLVAFLATWVFIVFTQSGNMDFLTIIGVFALLPPVALIFKFAPKLEWFARFPLNRFAKKSTANLRIPEFLIQSDVLGREMNNTFSGEWSPTFAERYFQRLEMEPALLASEATQLPVIEEFQKVGMHDLQLLTSAKQHWSAVDALVKVAADAGSVLKDDQLKADAAFLTTSLRNPEFASLLDHGKFGEFFDLMTTIQADAEKLLDAKLPALPVEEHEPTEDE